MIEPKRLHDQVALVTGASRGIGRAVAVALAREGAAVVVNFRANASQAAETVRNVQAMGGRAIAVAADVSRPNEAARLVEQTCAAHGRLDILVNNAGIQRSAAAHRMSDPDWHDVIDMNLNAVFHLTRAALRAMYERGAGQIVNVASASAYMGQPGAASYVASKHGLIGFTRTVALEAIRRGVRVNAVAPGLTDTDLVRVLTDAQRAALLATIPQGRLASPEEIAAMVRFVATEATYSVGNVFHASGGLING